VARSRRRSAGLRHGCNGNHQDDQSRDEVHQSILRHMAKG
jgi:hypothetical protein